jgi:ribosomal protein L23
MLTYITTLVACLFRVAIAITAYFNLKIKQFNVVNVFVNTKRDSRSVLVAYKLLNRFKQPKIYVKINRALYKIKDSLAL